MRAELRPDTPAQPGQAILVIRDWPQAAPPAEISILNNQAGYLHPAQRWGAAEHWFAIQAEPQPDESVRIPIGPDLLDPMLSASNAAYRVTLRHGPDQEPAVNLRVVPGLVSSAAAGPASALSRATAAAPAPAPAPVTAAPVPTEPEAPEAPPPTPSQPTQARPGRWIALAAVAALAVGIGAYLLWPEHAPAVAAAEPPTTSQPAPAPASKAEASLVTPDPVPVVKAACDLSQLGDVDEATFLQACVGHAQAADALLSVVGQAKAAGQCSVAQRLFAHRAQTDAQVALAYAREYDPAHHQPNPCFATADQDAAAYWYETAVSLDPNLTQASARLKELQP